MARIAIIDNATDLVINIGEGDTLPTLLTAPDQPEGETENEADVEARAAHNAFVNAHSFEFSDVAQIGDTYDGENFTRPDVEPEPITEAAATARRDTLLKDSDWVVIKAMELGEPVPSDWAAYRAELRALDQSPSWPNVAWPEKPE